MIVRRISSPQLGELGFSLKPPAWLRNAVSSAVSKAKVNVNIPTPGGTITVDPRDPGILDMLKKATLSFSASSGNQPPTNPVGQANAFVESIPGGWATVAAGAVAIFLLARKGR